MQNLGTTEVLIILIVVFALFGFRWVRRTRAAARKVRGRLRSRAEKKLDRARHAPPTTDDLL
ncbi:MAG: hypothetical protein JXN59_11285 [Anaerolineae bacterium]|nr:hypothetical protein [Anaerolineae bacterium]